LGKRGASPKYRVLLRLWDGKNRNNEFRLREIREWSEKCCPELKKKSPRTLMRYLERLRKSNLLEKRVVGKTRLPLYSLSNKGIKEAIRQKSSSLLDSMPVDGAAEFRGSFHLPWAIEVNTECTRLKWLGRLEGEDALPHPELTYALYHHSGKDSQKKVDRLLQGFVSNVLLERLLANVVMSSVHVLTEKDSDYIESMDELVDWYKDALDQKFILMLVYDGKSVAEKVKWSQIKEEAKKLQQKWRKERIELMVSEKLIEAYKQSLSKEDQTAIEEKATKRHLELLVTSSIQGVSLQRFRSEEDAINAAVEESNEQSFALDMIKESVPQLLPLLKDTVKMKEIITNYLSSENTRFVLHQEKYQYPSSSRVHDVYIFRPKVNN